MSAPVGLSIRQSKEGIVFSVRVLPRATHPGIAGLHEGALKLRIAAPPVDGRANEACVETLARWLGIKKGQVAILAGHAGRTKTFAVTGISAERLSARVDALTKQG